MATRSTSSASPAGPSKLAASQARSAAPETVADVWDYYEQDKLEPGVARLEALLAAARYPVRIKCVAVWDTVGGRPWNYSSVMM